jgi:hypothetical protein
MSYNKFYYHVQSPAMPAKSREVDPDYDGERGCRLGIGKKNDNIETPDALYKALNDEFHFDFDPCPLNAEHDATGNDFEWKDCNFVNPPFSKIGEFIRKGIQQKEKGRKSVFLLTSRPHTNYWHAMVYPNASEIRFLQRGVMFKGFKKPLPTPISIIVFDPKVKGKLPLKLGKSASHNYVSIVAESLCEKASENESSH